MIGQAALFVAVVTALASCAVNGSPARARADDVKGPPTHKCCLPTQWSGLMTVLESINTGALTILNVQMDYDRKQQVILNFTGDFETPKIKMLIDYEKGMLYVIQGDTCVSTPHKIPMERCIPDNAEYLGSSFLGSTAAGQLPYDGWRMNRTISGMNVVSTLALTKQGCVPIVEGVAYPQAPNMNQLFMFSGFQSKLIDPSAFTLPQSCFQRASPPM